MKMKLAMIVAGMMLAGCMARRMDVAYEPVPLAQEKPMVGEEGILILVKQEKTLTKEERDDPRRFSCRKIILRGKEGTPDIELITESDRYLAKALSGEVEWPSNKPDPDDSIASNEVGFGFLGMVTRAEKFKNTATDIRDADWFIPGDIESNPITDLAITIGSRKLRAVVVDATQAARLYKLALSQGRHAVMVKADDGGWCLRLGQIRPGENIETKLTQAWCHKMTDEPHTLTAVQNGVRFTAEAKSAPGYGHFHPVTFTRTPAPGVADSNPSAFPVLHVLWASREINRILTLDRESGRPDHAKEAWEIAREAKIICPVSSFLMVDAKKQEH